MLIPFDFATGSSMVPLWLPHTARAALTGLRKKGHTLTSDKQDGVRRYRVHAAIESGAAR